MIAHYLFFYDPFMSFMMHRTILFLYEINFFCMENIHYDQDIYIDEVLNKIRLSVEFSKMKSFFAWNNFIYILSNKK